MKRGGWIRALRTAACLVAMSASVARADTVQVHAAGSLRAALTDVARAFEARSGHRVALVFGASGLLKDRLAAGEPSQAFASANTAHPQALHEAGKAEAPQFFARNALCILAAPGFDLRGRPLAQRLLDDDVRVATSTPKADPAGDYAFQMFERIEATGAAPAGSSDALKRKALQLTGGPGSPPPPADRSAYAAVMGAGQADAFVTYCTNAAQARREVPTLRVLDVPADYNVSAAYGIVLVRPVVPAARDWIDFVLSADGQQILRGHGFSAP